MLYYMILYCDWRHIVIGLGVLKQVLSSKELLDLKFEKKFCFVLKITASLEVLKKGFELENKTKKFDFLLKTKYLVL